MQMIEKCTGESFMVLECCFRGGGSGDVHLGVRTHGGADFHCLLV